MQKKNCWSDDHSSSDDEATCFKSTWKHSLDDDSSDKETAKPHTKVTLIKLPQKVQVTKAKPKHKKVKSSLKENFSAVYMGIILH